MSHVPTLGWWGCAGDTTLNLLWRLQNGEGPAAFAPKVAVVLIGTNDLTNPMYGLVRCLTAHLKDMLSAQPCI